VSDGIRCNHGRPFRPAIDYQVRRWRGAGNRVDQRLHGTAQGTHRSPLASGRDWLFGKDTPHLGQYFSGGDDLAGFHIVEEAQRSSARVSGVASGGSGAQRLRRLVVRVVDKNERGSPTRLHPTRAGRRRPERPSRRLTRGWLRQDPVPEEWSDRPMSTKGEGGAGSGEHD
jgi:hypothetical protein